MDSKKKNEIVPVKNLVERADFFAQSAISPATRRAYETDWALFYNWCKQYNFDSLPATPETICLYLTHLADAGATSSTISRKCTSIGAIHRATDNDSPCKSDKVGRVLKGIKKSIGTMPTQPHAISWDLLVKMVGKCDSLIIGVRDAALLALGWASALRRSELTALNIGDLEFVDEGVILTIRRSKTDQEGRGAKIGIPRSEGTLCPVQKIEHWIDRRSGTKTDPNFIPLSPSAPLFTTLGPNARTRWFWPSRQRLSARIVSDVVKTYVSELGLDPSQYSAHSLRRGLATEAGARGVPERIISRHTRHHSLQVLRGYIEAGTIWSDNPLHAIY
jgi:site-specific recombinase XerD